MASVNSATSSFLNSYGIKNKGIGGLVSGLDTDSLVEALTSGTRSKIAAQGQKKTLLNWKVSAYRTMASALKAYQTKYLKPSATNKTNLTSNTFFNTYKATSSSDKVSVTASSGSILGDFTIDRVAQLATTATLTNKTSLSTDLTFGIKVGQTLDVTSFTGRVLQLDDGSGTPKNINLDSLNQFLVAAGEVDSGDGTMRTVYKLDETQKDEIKEELQRLMTEAFGTKNNYNADGTVRETVSKVQVSIAADGTIKLDSDASKLSVYSDCDAIGMRRGQANRIDMSTKLGAIPAFAGVQGDVLSFSINGVEITVSKNETLTNLKTKIDTSAAGVRFDYNQYTDEFILTSKTYGAGNNIDIRDTQGNLMNTLFGAASGGGVGTNWLMSTETPIGQEVIYSADGTGGYTQDDINKIMKNISNLEFSLTIDGVTKLIKADSSGNTGLANRLSEGTSTIYDIINSINKGITNAFSDTNVRFSLNADGKIQMTGGYDDLPVAYAATATIGGSNNALAALGVTENAIGNTVFDMGYGTTITAANSIDYGAAIRTIGGNISGTFDLTINGETKQIEIFELTAVALNDAVKKAFGSSIANQVNFSMDGDRLKLETTDTNMAITIGHGVNIGNKVDVYAALGFTGTAVNNVNPGGAVTTFGDLKNGDGLSGVLTFTLANSDPGDPPVTVSYSSATTLQEFLNNVNEALGDPTAATIVNGRLSIKSEYMTGVSDSGNILKKLFGIKADADGNVHFEAAGQSYGTDANGESKFVEGKDAEIIINGRTLWFSDNTFTMNGTTVTLNGLTDGPVNVNVKSDPDDVIDRLKDWIEDYNAMIATLNSAIYEGKAKGYEPLTDEQKAQMTDDQIKTWEAEAKKGILRNDQTLAKIVNDMREAMYKKVEAAGISLFDIGITTKTYSYTDIAQSGQLEISDESKLREMLTKDPDKVRILFTDADGLAARMNNVINAAADTSSINRGSLYRLAGTETLTGDNSSVLGKQIDQIDKYISTLTARLQSEYTRYWKQFTALETAIQKMNAQSSWLTQS